jgi:hypothetical protein
LGLNYSAHPEYSLPPLVMAKRLGYDMPGLLIPNPYFAEEGLGIWARTLKHIKAKVAERPFASRIPRMFWPVCKSKFYDAFVLNRRVDLHAIDATPARWRGDVGSSPLDGASAATPSPRNDLCTRHTG